MSLLENLRREIIIIEPEEDTTDCTQIGEEITEVLELIPAEVYVKRYVRPMYARAIGEGIIIGLLSERVIDTSIHSESVLAQMSIDKYVYGLPLHRQIDKSRRLGLNIPATSGSIMALRTSSYCSINKKGEGPRARIEELGQSVE